VQEPTPPAPATRDTGVLTPGVDKSPTNGLYSITGLTTYFFGNAQQAPALVRLEGGNSEQADASAALEYAGSGTP
jgi:hypothetical protein